MEPNVWKMIFVQLTLVGVGARFCAFMFDLVFGPTNEKGVLMTKKELSLITIALFMVFMLGLTGCGRVKHVVEKQACTVSKQGADAIISCPDGTNVTLPATIIDVDILIPVVIDVPVKPCECKKGHKNCKKH